MGNDSGSRLYLAQDHAPPSLVIDPAVELHADLVDLENETGANLDYTL
jgi:hypothetical protein